MPARFVVEVDADQYERLARPTQPLAGVAELIWNGLDAEADEVDVHFEFDPMEAIARVVVVDDGHGMTHDEAVNSFSKLGGSWKRLKGSSKTGLRALHGKSGEGRFRAFSLGRQAEWATTAARADGQLEQTTIEMRLGSSECLVSDPETVNHGTPGTRVTIIDPGEHVGRLLAETGPIWLVARFAVYLLKYPKVRITYSGEPLDVDQVLSGEANLQLPEEIALAYAGAELKVYEWSGKAGAIRPSILLCDANGVALHELPLQSDPKLGSWTAYLEWQGFTEYPDDLMLGDLDHPVLGPLVTAARDAIDSYLARRAKEARADLIGQWKEQDVYPYREPPTTETEKTERRVFDAVALNVAAALPTDRRSARLSLRLMREALEQSPGALHRVLEEVLDLSAEQIADLDALLKRTTFASLIATSKLVTDRLSFLDDLEGLLFDEGKRERLLERRELHRILADGRTWIFGEEFSLVLSDKGLTKVLAAHSKLLGAEVAIDEPVKDASGSPAIIDLMLSKMAVERDRRRHLVVELKRPVVRLSDEELTQIAKYALAVSRDERFHTGGVTWTFLLIGNEIDEFVEEATHQKDRPPGFYRAGDNYEIWVRRWADLLEENRRRLHFYRDNLQYKAADDLDLQGTLEKYLPAEAQAGA